MSLLHILISLQSVERHNLIVAHYHHATRGKENDADELFVRTFAEAFDLPFYSKKRQSVTTDESSLRSDRYNFLYAIKERTHAHGIILAHHRDDQVETFLHHLIRGSARTGLSGMSFRSRDLIRPLLITPKTDLELYAKEHHVPFREDSSNRTTHYTRNRIRQELLPMLKKFNPNIMATLARNIPLMADEDLLLESFASAHYKATQFQGNLVFSLQHFLSLEVPIQRRFLKKSIETLETNSSVQAVSTTLIEEIRNTLLRSKQKTSFVAFSGLIFERRGDTVRLFLSDKTQ